MDDRELDAILRQGLILANSPDRLNLPDEPFPTSESFERRMAQLLKHPVRYARKHRRAARPMWQKVLTKVGAAVLILTVSAGGVIFAVPSARAWAYNVVVQWLEEYVGFHFSGEEKGIGGIWRPAWLPVGFLEVSADDDGGYGRAVYQNENGISIHFSYQPVVNGNQFNMDDEHSDYQEIILNGHVAYLFVSNFGEKNSFLVWTDSDETVAFRLSYGNQENNGDDLIRIAESVEKVY